MPKAWKHPPDDPTKNWIGKSLELQIILNCGWSCANCTTYSQFHSFSFNRRGTMTLEQIRHFIGQMHAANAYYGRIRILGGEPTGHAKLTEIVELLHADLVVKGHVGFLEVITNGDNPERIRPIRHLLSKVRVSNERDKQKHHIVSMRQTPNTLGYEGIPCNQPSYCGASLSVYGFFPCSPGAGLARVRDIVSEHGKMTLPIVGGVNANWPKLQELCNHCPHALREEDKIKGGTGMQPGQHALSTPHPAVYEHLAPWMFGKSADWPIYGEARE